MASDEKLNIREMWKNRTTPWLDVPCGTCGKNIRLRAYSSEGGKPRNAGTPDETWYCAVCRHLLPPEESPAEPPKKVTRETCLHCEAPRSESPLWVCYGCDEKFREHYTAFVRSQLKFRLWELINGLSIGGLLDETLKDPAVRRYIAYAAEQIERRDNKL